MVKLLLLTGALGAVSGALGAPLTTSSAARTPALGWSSWNYFATAINESLILDMGDAMVETGLARLGFEYINVDAGALVRGRDNATGKLQVNNERFPRGMRYLADELHAKGLKLGVYTDLGDGSCGPGPGSFGHYAQDAQQVANEWRAHYLKVDFCGQHVSRTDPAVQLVAWQALSSAVARAAGQSGREVYVAICPHTTAPANGTSAPYAGRSVYAPPASWSAEQRAAVANSVLVEYLNTFDIWYAPTVPAGDGGPIPFPGGMLTNVDAMVHMTNLSFSQPGSWNDADMLQMCTYGEGATRHFAGYGMTLTEYESHYSVWAVLASPLIHAADLRTVGQRHPECLELMLNDEIIAVNQDPAGLPGRLVFEHYNTTGPGSGSRDGRRGNSSTIVAQAFARPLSGNLTALVLFNRGEAAALLSASWVQLALPFPPNTSLAVRDVLRKADAPRATTTYSAVVKAHGVSFVVLSDPEFPEQ